MGASGSDIMRQGQERRCAYLGDLRPKLSDPHFPAVGSDFILAHYSGSLLELYKITKVKAGNT